MAILDTKETCFCFKNTMPNDKNFCIFTAYKMQEFLWPHIEKWYSKQCVQQIKIEFQV